MPGRASCDWPSMLRADMDDPRRGSAESQDDLTLLAGITQWNNGGAWRKELEKTQKLQDVAWDVAGVVDPQGKLKAANHCPLNQRFSSPGCPVCCLGSGSPHLPGL